MPDVDRTPPITDLADTDPPNEPPAADGDWDTYLATLALWSDTWGDGDLDFAPDVPAEQDWPDTGYGPGGALTPGEWLMLGLRMASDWQAAFDAMHAPVREAA